MARKSYLNKKNAYLLLLLGLMNIQALHGYKIDTRPFAERFVDNWSQSLADPHFLVTTGTIVALPFLTYSAMNFMDYFSHSYTPIKSDIKFDDVIGAQQAKDALKDIVDALKYPERYKRIGARVPKGVLLEGPPGTGKTLLAKALAGEANVPFFAITGSEFSDKFFGVGPQRVRNLFAKARRNAPCIIFIDEMDGIGKRSDTSGSNPAATAEENRIIAELLAQIDGLKSNSEKPIILIGATNYRERIDEALLRPGRFDISVTVESPQAEDRKKILELYAKKITLGKSVNIDMLAVQTDNFSGADLETLVNQAALMAVRRNATAVEQVDFLQALKQMKESKNRLMSLNVDKLFSK